MKRLFHIARAEDWERGADAGGYRVSTLGRDLDQEGFIHLSHAHQVKGVADAFYRGMTDLVLLELDAERVADQVRLDPVPGTGELFPHLYGEITPDVVLAVRPLVPRSDGSFDPVA